MAMNRNHAARLLTAREMGLFEKSLSDRAPELDDRQLHATMRQLRNNRDKYQDLLRRQRVSSRARTGSKSGPQGTDNARTERKVDAFSEALTRLDRQVQARERAQQRRQGSDDPRPKAWREAGTRQGDPQHRDGPARSPRGDAPAQARQAPPGIRQAKKLQGMGQQRPQAHVSSRGRRQQARRDAGR